MKHKGITGAAWASTCKRSVGQTTGQMQRIDEIVLGDGTAFNITGADDTTATVIENLWMDDAFEENVPAEYRSFIVPLIET